MQVLLLGPLVVEDGATTAEVRGTRQQGLLTLLALHVGTVIPNERIVDELWGEDAPANPANALQAVVSRVRRVVGADALRAQGGGYVLDIPPEDVDAARFERLVSKARTELDSGRHAEAASMLEEALTLWRGPVLEELGDLPFARAAAGRLRELRTAATDAWADAELALGHHDALIPELRSAVDRDPLHEGGWARLMLALYRAGRQADALRAFQDARRILGEELGVEAGPELRSMEASILAQAPELDPPERTPATPPEPDPYPLPRELRRVRTTFVGRSDELEDLDRTLRDTTLITLVGPGGVGKTRLAAELAARRATSGERIVFVDLAPVVSEDDVAEAVAVALGGRDQAAFTGSSLDALERATLQVATGAVLVVVDNCEHVVDAAARVVEAVVGASDRVRVLATSREALGVPGERLRPLRSLTSDEALELFVDRARAVRPDFDPTDGERRTIAEVCERLDALPLAIELAAARVRALPVSEIADRLDDRFRLLTGGARTALPRQQTLRAVVDWSHELLTVEERHVLARLSVFVGGFGLDDAAAVVGGDKVAVEDVAEVVLHLVDRSLVTTANEQDTGRFGLLQTLWHYAREKLTESGDEALLRHRHARHFAELAATLEADLRRPGQRRAMDRLETEHENLRAALEWAIGSGDKALAGRIVAALGWFWYVRGYVSEGARWSEAVAGLPGELDLVVEARVLRYATLLGLFAGAEPSAAGRALELARRCGAPEEVGETQAVMSVLRPRHGDVDGAIAALDEAAAIGAASGNRWLQGTAAMLRSGILSGAHDVVEASRIADESVTHFRAAGDNWGLSMALMMRAIGRETVGDYDAALADFAEAHVAAEELGSDELGQHFLIHCGNICTLAGDPEGGRRHHEEAVAAARRIGSSQVLGMALNGLGLAARRMDDLDVATAAHDEARELYLAGGWTAGAALALAGLGFAAEQAGDADAALGHHLDGLDLARQTGDERAIALACEGVAGALARRGEHEQAAQLLGRAHACRTGVGAPLPHGERVDVDRIESAVVAALGSQRYESLAAAGAAADLDELLPR